MDVAVGSLIGFHFGIYFYLTLSIPTVILIFFNLCFLVFSFTSKIINFHISETKVYISFCGIISFFGFIFWGYVWYLNLAFASTYTFFLLLSLCPTAIILSTFKLINFYKTLISSPSTNVGRSLKLGIKDVYFNHTCKICGEQLGFRIKTGLLSCGHFFHKECILNLGDNACCNYCNIIISDQMPPFEYDSN
jgi:hypothetical protein